MDVDVVVGLVVEQGLVEHHHPQCGLDSATEKDTKLGLASGGAHAARHLQGTCITTPSGHLRGTFRACEACIRGHARPASEGMRGLHQGT